MITITATATDDLMAKLAVLQSDSTRNALLDEAEALLLNRIRTRFLAEEGPDGKWVPSKAGMIRRAGGFTRSNGRKWTGTGTLFASGMLFHSIQAHAVDNSSRSIGTDVFYAPFLQVHERGPWVFLGANDEDLSLMEKSIIRRVKELIE